MEHFREKWEPVSQQKMRYSQKCRGLAGAEKRKRAMRGIKIGVLAVVAAIGVAISSVPVHAQGAYPSRLVRIIVPFPPGSGTDILARLLSDHLARKWNASVITENMPGASGNLGAAEVFRAAPDGHTLLLCPPGPIATNKFLFKDLHYDASRWVAISWLTTVPYVLIARKSFDGGFKELMAEAKANPSKLTAAMPGPGGTAHLSAAYLEAMAGVKLVHVPYRGLGPAMNDIVAGHVDMMFDTFTTSLPQHRAERVKMVAVASPERLSAVPDVPAIAEFYPGYRSITWFGIVAPPNTPDALAERINRDVAEVMRQPTFSSRLREMQMEAVGSTREEAVKFFAEEAALWGKVIMDANITVQ
jgi:tripartite-type tricarboxylate transporter receptor subunit TctC